jgi:KaiC/GvpD/RAD55 family RecA-like ATPase
LILSELVQRSPIRIFEQSIHGGLKPGELGIIASPNGVGKTSVLVQLALDKLLQGKKVIHVSFTQHTQYVPVWYEDIFDEFINKKNLENAADIKNDLVKNRVLMNFNQDGMTKDQIIRSLRAMIIEGGFKAEAIIIDGFDFSRTTKESDLRASINNVKTFATEMGVSVWYSCSVKDDGPQYDKENIPLVISEFVGIVDVVIMLQPKPDHIELSISKDRDSIISKSMAMKLDPKTLLILEG